MQERLALFAPAVEIARWTMFFELRDVPLHRFPSFYLAGVIGAAPAQIIAAIPLKPAARVFMINPPFLPPVRQWFGGIHAETVELCVMPLCAELRLRKPRSWKFPAAIRHIFAAENARLEHLPGSQLRFEFRGEIFPDRFRQIITVPFLHFVVYDYLFWFHGFLLINYAQA